jgi:predicted  nucleic acid-binding Zn-ribbon protein
MGIFRAHLQACGQMAKAIKLPPQQSPVKPMLFPGMPMSFAVEQDDGFSREEYYRKKEQKAALAAVIAKLSDEAKFRVANCTEQVQILGEERTRLAAEKGWLYEEQDASKLQLSDLEAKLAGQQDAINKLLLQIDAQQLAVNILCVKRRKAEEKEREVNKNWWKLLIPGYGLYVGIDYLTDEDVQHLESLGQDIQRNQNDVADKRKALEDLEKKLADKKSEQTAMGAQVVSLEQAIGKTISRINEANRNLVQWMELQAYYSSLAAMLENDNCDIEGIRKQLIDLPKQLEKIA